MDLKFKRIGWMGGIYQKFETLCHEVDNIVNQVFFDPMICKASPSSTLHTLPLLPYPLLSHLHRPCCGITWLNEVWAINCTSCIREYACLVGNSFIYVVCMAVKYLQETVKYVENQAQSVGKSMKRFYSDVIHDILPPLKHDSQGVALKRSATIDTYDKSKAIEEDHINTIGKLSHIEPIGVDPIENQLDHASNKFHLSDQVCTPISIDALEAPESDIMSGQVSDLSEYTSSDVNDEENAIMEETSASEVLESISPSKEESFAASFVNEFIDCNDEKEGTINSIAVDVVKEQLDCASSELFPEGQLCNPNSVASIFGAEHVSSKQVTEVLKDTKPEVNTEGNATMAKPSASEVSELIFPSETELFGASLLSEFNKEPCWVEAEVSPVSSVHDVQCQQQVGTVCNNSAVDSVEKQHDHALSVLCVVNQVSSTAPMDPLAEALSDISSGPIFDNVSNTNSYMNMEENAKITKPSAS